MGLIDQELQRKHATEERLLHFAQFVREQKVINSRGMAQACLHSEGYRDFYGPVRFATGMHRSLWILPLAENPKVLIFTDRAEAKEYAGKLQKLLRENGYPFSKTRVEPVALQTSVAHPYSSLVLPDITYTAENRFIILMRVR